MPMPMLTDKLEFRQLLRQETKCHKCGEPCRYIHNDNVWCRTCLDIEQYPQYAHLTQEEREQMRRDAATSPLKSSSSMVNMTNLTGIGFR